jgi:hypothetical protein
MDGDSSMLGPDGFLVDAHGRRLEFYNTGAKRSHIEGRYDLVPVEGMHRVAAAMAHGAQRFGRDNWLKGMPIEDCLNHAIKHIYDYISGCREEDHLGHAAANLMMAAHFDRYPPNGPGVK